MPAGSDSSTDLFSTFVGPIVVISVSRSVPAVSTRCCWDLCRMLQMMCVRNILKKVLLMCRCRRHCHISHQSRRLQHRGLNWGLGCRTVSFASPHSVDESLAFLYWPSWATMQCSVVVAAKAWNVARVMMLAQGECLAAVKGAICTRYGKEYPKSVCMLCR